MSEALSGTIERVTFHNPENGFAVLRVQVKGKRDPVTVVGSVASAIAGEMLEATGAWERDPEHGPQFKAQEMRTATPQSVEGIEKFLGSGLIKGIGPQMAHRIVEVFGEKTLQVIDDSPTFLKEVRGIGAKRIQQIRESWREQRAVRGIMVFLQSHGVGFGRALRIYKTYGDKAIELVQANPYRLASDIWGIGFQTADQLAGKLGVPPTSPLRARAALRYILQQLAQEGHVGHPHSEVINRTVALTEIGRDVVVEAVEYLLGEKELIRETWEASLRARSASKGEQDPAWQDVVTLASAAGSGASEPWLYLPALYYAEIGVARALHSLQRGSHPLPDINAEVALDWVQKRMGLTLAGSQHAAVRQATQSKVLVITGGPGVGKTTIVRAILEIFSAKNQRCGLTAPTGRAAKRLAETTGREAKTIHRLLEFDPTSGGCRRDRDHPLDFDLLVVDEASMVDVSLMNQLLRAVPPAACVILVGDVDQLPSVGPGTVLADVIASKEVPVARLTEIFRQAEESGIVRAAHRVLQGQLPESAAADAPGDFYFIDCEQPATIIDRVVTLIRERIPSRFKLDSFRDIQVLTPMNRSELGVRNLNQRLQDVLNPFQEEPEVARFGWTFRRGDKVLQTQNNYKKEVFNGDIGRVAKIDIEEQELTVDYDGRPVVYDFGELDELSLAYALTIHKSQGCEYPAVVIPLHTQHYMFLQRNLLYTAITRGKKLVVIVGSGKALALAVRRQDTQRRYTALCQRLREAAEAS